MNCYLHADRQAELHCAACGNLICEQCDVLLAGHHVCKKCLAEAESVPAQMALAPRSDAAALALFNRINFGLLSACLVVGGIMGAVGGSMVHHMMWNWNTVDIVGVGLGSLFAGVVMYSIGALMAYLFIPAGTIREKGGVLGLFGINNPGLFVFLTLIVAAIVAVCVNS